MPVPVTIVMGLRRYFGLNKDDVLDLGKALPGIGTPLNLGWVAYMAKNDDPYESAQHDSGDDDEPLDGTCPRQLHVDVH